ncbi:MAG: putative zinc metalloprotease [Parcubacteria bacterium C7867-008]|nr:MAG: putative zinc metalloprotease [Parcubacteria bacterium C7867-008]
MSSLGDILSKKNISRGIIATLCLLVLASAAPEHPAFAQTAVEVQAQIDEHNAKIKALDAEIAAYQQQLNVLGGQKQTLTSAIKTIDVSRQQTSTQVKVTENKIGATDLELSQIRRDIATKQDLIELDRDAVARAIRNLQMANETTLVEQIFAADTLTDAWTDVDRSASITDALRAQVDALSGAKIALAGQENTAASTRDKLASLQKELVTQQKALDANKAAKAALLAQTKNQEGTYQSLIAKKRAEQKAFESELSALEDSLKVTVNTGSIPHVGSGVLAWPFSSTFAQSCLGKAGVLGNNFCITQYFGTTPFSTANPQVYNGSGHNAIDIGMPSGTPVLAALSGTVLGTGNTDAVPGCYSFGKWVLVQHANGLDTLYSHLSQISVSPGQGVSTGDAVGYSGMTGYATGPHLHFGVYVSQATQIMTLQAYRGATSPCANARMPVAPKDAYLNPMSYL